MTDLTQLAQQCGATVYRHRLTPQSPALAFGDEAWAKFEAEVQALREDAGRLDWVLMQVSGKEFRRIGVEYEGNCNRAAIDAAIAAGGKT